MKYRIETHGNSKRVTLVKITRISDEKAVFLHGIDAARFCENLELKSEQSTDDDVCAEYDHLLSECCGHDTESALETANLPAE